jgi:hypothetical protein
MCPKMHVLQLHLPDGSPIDDLDVWNTMEVAIVEDQGQTARSVQVSCP